MTLTPDEPATYAEALTRASKIGASKADDPGVMALFCERCLQQLVGAVSPALVWQGAQQRGMSALGLARLCKENPAAVEDLMWEVAA